MGIADDTQPRITQLFGIAPMQAVGKGVAHYGKILMTVGTDERIGIRTSVKPESVFPTKLYTPYSHTPAVSVNHMSGLVKYTHMQLIKIRSVRRPQMWFQQFKIKTDLTSFFACYGKRLGNTLNEFVVTVEKLIFNLSGKDSNDWLRTCASSRTPADFSDTSRNDTKSPPPAVWFS